MNPLRASSLPLVLGLLLVLPACFETHIGTNNSSPEATIELPAPETQVLSGAEVTFRGVVDDRTTDPEDLEVLWASSIDGELLDGSADADGNTEFTTSSLSAGTHTITLLVRDDDGASDEDSVELIVIADEPPAIVIVEPTADGSYFTNFPVPLQATVSDGEDSSDALRVSWTAESSGDVLAADLVPDGDGLTSSTADLAPGEWTLVATATDSVGNTASDTVSIVVGDAETVPTCVIDAPVDGTTVNAGEPVALTGTVADVEDAADALTVSVSSDLDGTLGAPSPDSNGAVALTVTLSGGEHVLTLSATDSAGLTGTDTVTVSVNELPSAPGISITPAAPTTNDDLTVVIETDSTDPDDGPSGITYDYSWSKDAVPAGLTSETVPMSATASGEVWTVAVTASDGLGTSLPATASVTIVNSPPSVLSVSITPATAYTDTTLTAVPSGWSDPDGDLPGYMYEWSADGSPVGGDTATLDGTNFSKGEVVAVTITPQDASSSGAPVTSSGVTILNSAPTAPSVTITPSPASEEDDLTCSYGAASDADGDSLSYTLVWLVDGGPSGETGTVVSSSATAAGETWTCQVTADDGSVSGPDGSASVGPLDGLGDPLTGFPIDDTLFPISLSPTSWGFGDLAFGPNGEIYAWANANGGPNDLVSIDGVTGALTTVNNTSFSSRCLGVTYRPDDGLIYVSCDSNTFFSLDPVSGAATTLVSPTTEAQALEIAPAGWGSYGGQVIASGSNGHVMAYDPTAGSWTVIVSNVGGTSSDLDFSDSGTLYVVEDSGDRVASVSPSGVVATIASGFGSPEGIAIDEANNRALVADSGNDQLWEADLTTGAINSLGSYDFDNGFFTSGVLMGTNGVCVLMTGESSTTLLAITP